ncbi:MAG TPA: hypothetical protein VGP64_13335 [Polyangia bacterium]
MRGVVAACLLLAGGGIAGGPEWRAVSTSGTADDRHRAVERLRASLGTAEVPPPAWLTARRGRAPDRDLEIGE